MNFPRYAEYKDSGVEWLGEVPGHWGVKNLKHIALFSGGGTPSRDNMTYWNGDIPWVSPKDMKAEKIYGTEECITTEGLTNSTSNLIAPGTVLMVVRSGILKHTIPVAINGVEVALNQDMKALTFHPNLCHSQFFLRWVQGLNNELLLVWAKQGATVESIEQEYLANTAIGLPPLPEQQAIAAFLDRETGKIDALVAEQEKLIALLKEKRQAVISHAVTKGLNPDAPMKDSGIEWLGEVPEHWEVVPLKHSISKIEQGWSPQCEGEPASEYEWGVLKVGCVNRDEFDPMEQKALPEEVAPILNYEVKAGDILMSRGNTLELVGMATFISKARPRLLLCDLLYRFHAKPGRADGRFLVFSIRSPSGRFQIMRDATGTSASMKKIGQGIIREFIIALPPLDEQSAIVAYLDQQTAKLDTLLSKAQHAINLLKERRTALISAAVTGKIDVRELTAKEH
ncbi:MAG: restriction endonuclease subunit S [Magnetococcales bacterium]|nr:restriction endonuclease subunit S [Magnetococcales bacterium]